MSQAWGQKLSLWISLYLKRLGHRPLKKGWNVLSCLLDKMQRRNPRCFSFNSRGRLCNALMAPMSNIREGVRANKALWLVFELLRQSWALWLVEALWHIFWEIEARTSWEKNRWLFKIFITHNLVLISCQICHLLHAI